MCVIRWLSVQCLDMESESESGTPELHEMTINFMPESYAFRPHGMYVRSNSPWQPIICSRTLMGYSDPLSVLTGHSDPISVLTERQPATYFSIYADGRSSDRYRYIDNSTSRAFVVSHGDRNGEESIAVFNIIAAEGGGRIPALDFAFALVSENIPYVQVELPLSNRESARER